MPNDLLTREQVEIFKEYLEERSPLSGAQLLMAEALCDTTLATMDERDRARKQLLDWEEREAAVCPEDVGFPELIWLLRAERDALRRAVEEAPHGRLCVTVLGHPCDCFKARIGGAK